MYDYYTLTFTKYKNNIFILITLGTIYFFYTIYLFIIARTLRIGNHTTQFHNKIEIMGG